MKIGLITIHFVSNLGAVLQAYATQTYLSRFGQVEIIDYRHNAPANRRVAFLSKQWFLGRLKKLQLFLHPFHLIHTKQRLRLFAAFRAQYLHLSAQSYRGDNAILKQPPQYDVYITGSDQIWNTSITHNSAAYFLHFTQSPHKYAFASSVGHDVLQKEEKKLATVYLPAFKQIAVREQGTAVELENLLHRPIQTVLDPVFLLDKTEWENLAKPVKLPKGNFIAVYALEDNASLRQTLKQAKKLHLPLVFIGVKSFGKGVKKPVVSPQEFLYILSHADYLITNSFHGFAFGLIFQKQIFVCEHTKRNLRLDNLLEQIGSPDKQISAHTPDIYTCQIDGPTAYAQLNIQQGKEYLAGIFRMESGI